MLAATTTTIMHAYYYAGLSSSYHHYHSSFHHIISPPLKPFGVNSLNEEHAHSPTAIIQTPADEGKRNDALKKKLS